MIEFGEPVHRVVAFLVGGLFGMTMFFWLQWPFFRAFTRLRHAQRQGQFIALQLMLSPSAFIRSEDSAEIRTLKELVLAERARLIRRLPLLAAGLLLSPFIALGLAMLLE